MQITVEQRNQYGAITFHPVCEQSKLFANIAKTKTLTLDALHMIKQLGYQVEVKQTVVTI
jgi:hypothetical protein